MRFSAKAVTVAAASTAVLVAGIGIAFATGRHTAPAAGKTATGNTRSATPAAASNLAPSPDEGVFTPIAPCRVVDTRLAGGRITTSARSFQISASTGFVPQGGKSGGCTIPASATAIAANLTAVQETAPGFLAAYPAGTTRPNSSVLNYTSTTLANATTLAVTPGTGKGLSVYASAPTNLVIDITGYYAPQITAYLTTNGSLFPGTTSRILSASRTSTGTYQITVDRDVYNCTATASPYSLGVYSSATTNQDHTVTVKLWTLSTTAVPVLSDQEVNLHVMC